MVVQVELDIAFAFSLVQLFIATEQLEVYALYLATKDLVSPAIFVINLPSAMAMKSVPT